MKRALIIVAFLLATSQAVPVQTEERAHQQAPPEHPQAPEQLQAQAQGQGQPADSIYYPVPPADALMGLNTFQNLNSIGLNGITNPYGYGLPYGYTSGIGNPGYIYPYGYGNNPYGSYGNPYGSYGYPYGSYGYGNNPYMNRLYSGYSYPPIIITLPRQQATTRGA
ncbi:shematrin-like protein 1 [Sardina pilchardus]|uniref:shematrin-like protein 1 n=1 Tax=Sardina pilchardus TaxID=27697 RepID=UPI002E0E95E4